MENAEGKSSDNVPSGLHLTPVGQRRLAVSISLASARKFWFYPFVLAFAISQISPNIHDSDEKKITYVSISLVVTAQSGRVV